MKGHSLRKSGGKTGGSVNGISISSGKYSNSAGRFTKSAKLKEAAALKYNPERDYAPEVTAAGRGYVAEKIIEAAKNSDVPVYRDEALAGTLNRLKVGDMIPRELYEAVAEVLAFVVGLDRKYGESRGESHRGPRR